MSTPGFVARLLSVALIGTVAGHAHSADPQSVEGGSLIGRLFHTPAEREKLDELARGRLPEGASGTSASASAPAAASTRRFDGYVLHRQRALGLWIDGERLAGDEIAQSGFRDRERVLEQRDPDGQPYRLAPGQASGRSEFAPGQVLRLDSAPAGGSRR